MSDNDLWLTTICKYCIMYVLVFGVYILYLWEEERMQQVDCEQWLKEAFDRIPWYASPMLTELREKYGEGFMQRIRDIILLPLLGYTSVRDAEEDLPYQRDTLYDILKLEGIGWFDLVEEITFMYFFYWVEYGLSRDPSTLSRNRVRLILDHTLIVKWGQSIADVANLFDHVTGSHHLSHKLLVAYITVGVNRFRFPLAVRLWSKEPTSHETHSELATAIIEKVHQEAQKRGISLSSVRVSADKDYCTDPLVAAVRRAGMVMYTTPQWNRTFTYKGRSITPRQIESESFPLEWRQSAKLRRDHPLHEGHYAYMPVEHATLGECALGIEEYVEAGTHKLKRHVYLCTDPTADGVRIVDEARKKRWPIEPNFRLSKQTGSYSCYQGTKQRANHAHYALGALRSILLEELLKLSQRRPSLSQGKRMENTSQLARFLSRNVRFDDIYKSERFIRLRRGSLKKASQDVEEQREAAG